MFLNASPYEGTGYIECIDKIILYTWGYFILKIYKWFHIAQKADYIIFLYSIWT